MKTHRTTPKTIDAYISTFPSDVQAILQTLRTTIQKAAPAAEETIKYQMPTFVLNGNLVHFAAWKKHIGLYPPLKASGAFREELAPYAGPKGCLKFPLDKPMPLGLIRKIVKIRVEENRNKAARRSDSPR
ncbi:MAG TPA: DUF1801 domain-containing protein [Gemmataceae bacterium]|nr:DUF1801 domain-containing protein [Gemmataceae bacterium]